MSSASAPEPIPSPGAAFLAGLKAGITSVFALVLFGTYVGIGALAHDLGFSIVWTVLSTLLVWAGPAQVILISALGSGASWFEAALAVGLSGVRLLPMVVALMPLLRGPQTRNRHLLLTAHLTAVSMWVEAQRLAPAVARERRIIFCNGLGCGLGIAAMVATIGGYYLAANLPLILGAALLMLTPLSFLTSVARNARHLADRAALVLGMVIAPALASMAVELDLLWAGIAGGTLGYGIHRLREALR